jgi:hypothetical protein
LGFLVVITEPILTKDGAHEASLSPDEYFTCSLFIYKKITLGILYSSKEAVLIPIHILPLKFESSWRTPEVSL